MALRVLLADSSETIRKVMQLSLQDFALDLKTVSSGLDVLEVAKTFRPDIVFVDVLLQKKTGYEVSQQLRTTPPVDQTPVVLMWSGFMDLDAGKYEASLATARLEKPFDSEVLRKLVIKLVPKVASQPLAQHLVMPRVSQQTPPKQQPPPPPVLSVAPAPPSTLGSPVSSIDSIELPFAPLPGSGFLNPTPVDKEEPASEKAPHQLTNFDENPESDWSMESFEEIQSFETPSAREGESEASSFFGDLTDEKNGNSVSPNDFENPKDTTDQFSIQTLSPQTPLRDFAPPTLEEISKATREVKIETPNPEMTLAQDKTMESWVRKDLNEFHLDLPDPEEEVLLNTHEEKQLEDLEPINESSFATLEQASPPQEVTPHIGTAFSEEQIERYLLKHGREIVERVAWKLLPDLASDIIKKELQRLLDEPSPPP